MNAHRDRLAISRLSDFAPVCKVARWVNSRLSARRARRMEEETLACLSTLEPSLLNDIGADIGKFGDLISTPAPQDPHVAARRPANPQPSRRSGRDERS